MKRIHCIFAILLASCLFMSCRAVKRATTVKELTTTTATTTATTEQKNVTTEAVTVTEEAIDTVINIPEAFAQLSAIWEDLVTGSGVSVESQDGIIINVQADSITGVVTASATTGPKSIPVTFDRKTTRHEITTDKTETGIAETTTSTVAQKDTRSDVSKIPTYGWIIWLLLAIALVVGALYLARRFKVF